MILVNLTNLFKFIYGQLQSKWQKMVNSKRQKNSKERINNLEQFLTDFSSRRGIYVWLLVYLNSLKMNR